ncbi:MAG: CBS domain-containing protein [candidate division Zixibacteria bacterium]|nr:CBS domain-containing protein [Candidatus Tariuqbacter arcticus]
MKVEQVMTKDIISVSPHSLMIELRDLLREKRISGVPVVDEGRLVGLVSIEDFIKCLAEGEIDIPIKDRMSINIKTLYNNEPLVQAVEEFDRTGYGRFPVIDRESGELVGIITKGDIVRGLLKKIEIEYHAEEIHRYRASHFFEDIVADKTTLIFQYKVISKDFNRAGQTSSGLKKTLRRMGMPSKVIRRVAIATYEAEMNIVVFTDGGQITARITPQEIRIDIVDSGPGIPDIEKAMQPGFSTAPDWIRELGFGAGMGLPNIKKCSDQMNLDSTVGKGTHLEITFNLNEKMKLGSGNDS